MASHKGPWQNLPRGLFFALFHPHVSSSGWPIVAADGQMIEPESRPLAAAHRCD
jgi:hypothetical protein